MFRIRVTKGIWTADRERVERWLGARHRGATAGSGAARPSLTLFFHEMELPFAPFPGLRIACQDWECEPLERVEWSAHEGLFKCAVADEYPHRSGRREIGYEMLLERALGNGWQPSKPIPLTSQKPE